jgi:hypothetical protein
MTRPFSRYARSAWLAILLVVVSSCSTSDGISGPDQATAPNMLLEDGGLLGGDGLLHLGLPALLACPGQPEASAEEAIGPEGGTLQIGPHQLVVPPGALDSLVLISAVAPADSVLSVQFAPEGLTFARPARLTLSYANCPLVPSLLPKRIAYTSDVLELLEVLLSSDNLLRKQVSADLDHFSRYAVAW